MVNALIVYGDGDPLVQGLAMALRQGVEASGSTTFVGNYSQSPEGFDIIFVGFGSYAFGPDSRAMAFVSSEKLSGKHVAFFCVHSGGGKAVVEHAVKELESKGGVFVNSIAIPARGILKHIGKGRLQEIDFVRTAAFGEKTCNRIGGVRIVGESEKQKIRGYRREGLRQPE